MGVGGLLGLRVFINELSSTGVSLMGLNKSPLWTLQSFGIAKVPLRPGVEAILVQSLSQVLQEETVHYVGCVSRTHDRIGQSF